MVLSHQRKKRQLTEVWKGQQRRSGNKGLKISKTSQGFISLRRQKSLSMWVSHLWFWLCFLRMFLLSKEFPFLFPKVQSFFHRSRPIFQWSRSSPQTSISSISGALTFFQGVVFFFSRDSYSFPRQPCSCLWRLWSYPWFFPHNDLIFSLLISFHFLRLCFSSKNVIAFLVNLWLVGLSHSWNKPLPCSQRSSKLGNPKVLPWKWHDHRLVCDVKQDPTMAITKLS